MHPADELRDWTIKQFTWSINRIGFVTRHIPADWVDVKEWWERCIAGPATRGLQYNIDFLSTGSASHLEGLRVFWGEFTNQVENLGEALANRWHLQAVNNDSAWIDGKAPEKYAEGLRLMALGFAYTKSQSNRISDAILRDIQQLADYWMGKALLAISIRLAISIIPSLSGRGALIKAGLALMSLIGSLFATPYNPNNTIPKLDKKWPELDLW